MSANRLPRLVIFSIVQLCISITYQKKNNNKKLTNKNRSEFQKEFAGIIFRLQIKMFYENISKYAEPDLLSS